jgi:hypothetical protein
VVATLRWLADATTYAIADITLDDDGTHAYAYRGTATGAQLKKAGFPIDLTENTARGKAFWIQAMRGDQPQLLYLDENIGTATLTGARGEAVTVIALGTPGATTAAIVVDPHRDLAATATVRLDAAGHGRATVRAADLRLPVPVPTIFPEPVYSEAELLPYTTGPGQVPTVAISEGNASNGSWILAQCTAVGQYIAELPAGRQAALTVDSVNIDPFYAGPAYLFWAVAEESAAGVATVDQHGVVAAGQPGTATVTVRSQITREATAALTLTVT